MGNNNPKPNASESYSAFEDSKHKQVKFQEINTNASYSLFRKSFISLGSQQSVYSVSRPWSRVSRRRWKESTLTLPYESSKTAWPVSQLESYFLPVFPVKYSSFGDKYQVIEEVASGAFGKVYKVYSTDDKKYYALKILSKSKIIKENAVNQVKEEVQIQGACGHHSFIVNSPCHWQNRKKLFIISDFINNGELYRLLDTHQQLPVELVKLYVAQLALALDFLHNAGVIYRDLKPENILLDHNENCHITDFGLSKWLAYGSKTKTFCGTPRYMAPEVRSMQPYGHACDWWSLGVIACQMLTGKNAGRKYPLAILGILLLVEELAQSGHLKVIPNNTEQYVAMVQTADDSDIKFKFIDSFRFMASSLEKLASNLEGYPVLESQFEDDTLLKRKGVFPYSYMSCWERLSEGQLPPIQAFHNDLSNTPISMRDYEHAQSVWREFKCQTLGEYSDLYMKTDVLLLADVFENFRESYIKNYGLDAAHYYTAPGLSWDAMLKHTSVELDTLQDVDTLMFLEKGIRGGMTQCSSRYAKANNKYMPDYDPALPSTYLMYYDINAMYSWAMSQSLPTEGLEWVEDAGNLNFHVPDDNPEGYILEVDLEYPQHIHDRQRDLPMGPTKQRSPGSAYEKMLATLYSKEKYVVHYRNLKQYLAEGIRVTKIHRALRFKQSPWLKPYIDLNTTLRQGARNEFEKNLFKLMNNAVFGKTMENVRLRRNIKIVDKWDGRYGAEALISRPNFKCSTIFNDN